MLHSWATPVQHTFGLPEVLMSDHSARFFLCACCRVQVLVCSHCDRGQIYCHDACAATTRKSLQREAARRYQCSRAGRFKHAARMRRWRERQAALAEKVTHQGSQDTPSDVVLPVIPSTQPCSAPISISCLLVPSAHPSGCCHWCCTHCVAHVRLGFLRHHRESNSNQGDSP